MRALSPGKGALRDRALLSCALEGLRPCLPAREQPATCSCLCRWPVHPWVQGRVGAALQATHRPAGQTSGDRLERKALSRAAPFHPCPLSSPCWHLVVLCTLS